MFRRKLATCAGLSLAVVAAWQAPALAKAPPTPQKLVIGVDHVDSTNQSDVQHRWFEYTDFFAREVTVHRGEVMDFRFAPGNLGHAIGLAPSAETAREVYPIATTDSDDRIPAIGSGKPKLELGPSNFVITDGSTHGGGTVGMDPTGGDRPCGVAPLPVCTFKGGNDIEAAGPIAGTDQTNKPVTVDWRISIDAAPGEYAFLCWFHPGMQGHFRVVDSDDGATSQAENDFRANIQFVVDRALATGAEARENVPRFSGGLPGTRTYHVAVGVTAADQHANVLEMLPQHLDLVDGDKVTYSWEQSPNEAHTVSFPADSPILPSPAGFDCGSIFQTPGPGMPCADPFDHAPELIFDPGTAASGSPLTSPKALLDAGVHIGTAYDIHPISEQWTVISNRSTAAGTYDYQCTIHDVMHGSLTVRSR